VFPPAYGALLSSSIGFVKDLLLSSMCVESFIWVVRRPVELEGYKAPPELMRILPNVAKARREREGIQQIGAKHPDFVLGLQELLDLLWSVNGSISECAALLGLSTGALSRLIVSDRTVWNAVNNLRISHNLKPLRGD
jgi:hypothetical protein